MDKFDSKTDVDKWLSQVSVDELAYFNARYCTPNTYLIANKTFGWEIAEYVRKRVPAILRDNSFEEILLQSTD